MMRKSHEIPISGSPYEVLLARGHTLMGSLISAASSRDGPGRAEAVDGGGMADEACDIHRRLALPEVRRAPNEAKPSRGLRSRPARRRAPGTRLTHSLRRDRPTGKVCHVNTRRL